MERHAVIEHTPSQALISGIHDEALFVQFAELLYDSGFLFDDATEAEIEKGQQVIQEFYAQANEMVMHYLSETHLHHFINYLNEHLWTKKEKQHKVHAKILKEFEQLSYGSRHSFNIRRNIHLELLKFHHHAFREFLLYITAYYILFLKKHTGTPTNISPEPKELVPPQEPPLSDQILEEEIVENFDTQEDFDDQDDSLKNDEKSVVYGIGRINKEACIEFIHDYPDSALKFLFRLDLNNKPLPMEFFEIYKGWEARGMRRGHVRKYVLELMEWEALPTGRSLQELSNELKERIYDLKFQEKK